MSTPLSIGSFQIGENSSPFIVAEVGINHNGSLDKAIEMIEVAQKAGASAVKFQTFKATEFISDPDQQFTYNSQGKTVTESMLAMFKRYEFSPNEWRELKKHCQKTGIVFLSTPQNTGDLSLLLDIGIDAIKVGSDDFTNIPLLKTYANTKLPMIISCGMSTLSESYEALEAIGAFDGYPCILCLCTSEYPTPPENINIRKLDSFRASFPMVHLGFSDHSLGSTAATLAVGKGAVFFEKHFTLSQDLPGPDHWFSENPEGLSHWIKSINEAHLMLGSSLVRPTQVESENKKAFQRLIVAANPISKGHLISESDLCMKRLSDGIGLTPNLIDYIIGSTANFDFKEGDPIRL
ncbi:N-acetylneuraminate synthase [bacterium]|jgi:N,N'-diacetyllegionaminate synthase|nr:N-acetylneuraminate synthase [bacterium]